MSLSIGNFVIECQVPAPADPARARAVLDLTLLGIRRNLSRLLQRALAAEDDNRAIVFIERLGFEALISAEWSEDDIACEVGRQALRSLWGKVGDRESTRFFDKAEHLARFLLDVAEGAGFTREWHRSFDGLKLLSTSAIVRTLIARDACLALEALSRLGPASVERILGEMSDTDARRALAAMVAAGGRPCRDLKAVAEALAAVGHVDTSARRSAFAVALFRQTGTTTDAMTLRLAEILLVLAQTGLAVSAEEAVRSVPVEESEGIAEDAVIAALKGDVEELPEALAILGGIAASRALESDSRCGGVWLLVPYVLDLAPAVAHTALALAAGSDAQEVWRDDALRDALGVPPDDNEVLAALGSASAGDFDEVLARPFTIRRRDLAHLNAGRVALGVSRATARFPMRAAASALRCYANRLPGFADSSFAYLWTNLLTGPAAIRVSETGIAVALSPPLLDVVWRLSGAGNADFRLADTRHVVVGVRR
jgi:hypothetical protein